MEINKIYFFDISIHRGTQNHIFE